MSGFDENPFDDNPFKDPAIQQVTKNTATTAAKDLEDYNPFDDAANQRPTTVPTSSDPFDPIVRGASNPVPQFGDGSKSPAVMSPTQEGPPPAQFANRGQPAGVQGIPISTEELQRRQEELERKARELELREEQLRNNPYNVRRNNWPPLPEKFPVQPCFYQDINVDIPVEFQRIVRHLYYLWVLHAMVLFVNCLIWVLRVFTIHDKDSFIGCGMSLVYIAIFTPVSYVCWFRPAYKAFRSDSSFSFMVFFFVFFIQFVIAVLLSTIMTGSCGIVDGISLVSSGEGTKIFTGVFVLLVGLCFAVCAILDLFMLMRVHRIYRSSGASFAKAQQEFTTGVMRNEHVQGAAANIASEAIRSQFRGPAQGGNGNGTNNPPPPRY